MIQNSLIVLGPDTSKIAIVSRKNGRNLYYKVFGSYTETSGIRILNGEDIRVLYEIYHSKIEDQFLGRKKFRGKCHNRSFRNFCALVYRAHKYFIGSRRKSPLPAFKRKNSASNFLYRLHVVCNSVHDDDVCNDKSAINSCYDAIINGVTFQEVIHVKHGCRNICFMVIMPSEEIWNIYLSDKKIKNKCGVDNAGDIKSIINFYYASFIRWAISQNFRVILGEMVCKNISKSIYDVNIIEKNFRGEKHATNMMWKYVNLVSNLEQDISSYANDMNFHNALKEIIYGGFV